MSLVLLKNNKSNQSNKNLNKDWPSHIPMPSNDDVAFLAEMSARETSSSFFDTKSRSGMNGRSSSRNNKL